MLNEKLIDMKTKKYKQFTKEQIKTIKKFEKKLDDLSSIYFSDVNELEVKMAKELGITDAEFFMVDGEYVGVGNFRRSYKLYNFN